MKKLLALFLMAAMLFSFASCNSGDDHETPSNSSGPDATVSVGDEVAMEETVIADKDGIKITAVKVGIDGEDGKIALRFENTTDSSLTASLKYAVLNGYMIETEMFNIEVDSEETVTEVLTIAKAQLEMAGIKNITDAGAVFGIYDTESRKKLFETEYKEFKTEAPDNSVDVTAEGKVIYDGNGVKLIYLGQDENASDIFSGAVIYAENNTDETIKIFADEVTINDTGVSSIYAVEILPGKKAVEAISFYADEMEERGIESMDTLSFGFDVMEPESLSTIFLVPPYKAF